MERDGLKKKKKGECFGALNEWPFTHEMSQGQRHDKKYIDMEEKREKKKNPLLRCSSLTQSWKNSIGLFPVLNIPHDNLSIHTALH